MGSRVHHSAARRWYGILIGKPTYVSALLRRARIAAPYAIRALPSCFRALMHPDIFRKLRTTRAFGATAREVVLPGA